MSEYIITYKMSYGLDIWQNKLAYIKASSAELALTYLLDDLEADWYRYDFIKLEPGEYNNGALYTVEDTDCLCVVCFKDFKVVEV